MRVAPKKVVDATALQHNLSDFKISVILWIVFRRVILLAYRYVTFVLYLNILPSYQ